MLLALEGADFDLLLSSFELFRAKVLEASQALIRVRSPNESNQSMISNNTV